MSKHIYIFNPEHDLCIANGDENFVPPRSAVGFAKENTDLSDRLPYFYSRLGNQSTYDDGTHRKESIIEISALHNIKHI